LYFANNNFKTNTHFDYSLVGPVRARGTKKRSKIHSRYFSYKLYTRTLSCTNNRPRRASILPGNYISTLPVCFFLSARSPPFSYVSDETSSSAVPNYRSRGTRACGVAFCQTTRSTGHNRIQRNIDTSARFGHSPDVGDRKFKSNASRSQHTLSRFFSRSRRRLVVT